MTNEELWRARTEDEWRERYFRALAGERMPPDEWAAFYVAYLTTTHWASVKNKTWIWEVGQCRRCGSCESLDCHHTNYRFLFREAAGLDVVLLCRVCHASQHYATKRKWHSQIYNPYILGGGGSP